MEPANQPPAPLENPPVLRAPGTQPLPPWKIWLLFSFVLLATLAFQLPGVASFQKFCFYDEGAWIHLVQQVAHGAVPTIDIGYSYGSLPLILSRVWFALFGYSAWAFIAFVTTCNLAAAWGFAQILSATGATWKRTLLACLILPLAIMPNAYSLMHPLEMALIVLALAQLARARYATALSFATLTLLTKPSMAYVLGLVLLLLAAWIGRYGRRFWRVLALPAVVGVIALAGTILILGLHPALANILPLKAAAAYDKMGFGIFRAGLVFWFHPGGPGELFDHYLLHPAAFWIVATFTLWILGLLALARVALRRPRPSDPLLATLALLHAAFVFKFYGWEGSWTYYSYLPVLGVLVGLRNPRRQWLFYTLIGLGALGLFGRYQESFGRWWGMHRASDCGSLWLYQDELDESRRVRQLAATHHTLFLVHGILPDVWPEVRQPPVWFVSPGVLLDKEFDAIRQQLRASDLVVLYTQYDPKQEAWAWEELATERAQFEDIPLWRGHFYTVYQRKPQKNP